MSYNPYSNSYVIDYGDGDVSLERRPSNIDLSNATTHTVLEGETLHSIAFKYYGDSGYWTVIAEANSIFFPLRELQPGDQIYIP